MSGSLYRTIIIQTEEEGRTEIEQHKQRTIIHAQRDIKSVCLCVSLCVHVSLCVSGVCVCVRACLSVCLLSEGQIEID